MAHGPPAIFAGGGSKPRGSSRGPPRHAPAVIGDLQQVDSIYVRTVHMCMCKYVDPRKLPLFTETLAWEIAKYAAIQRQPAHVRGKRRSTVSRRELGTALESGSWPAWNEIGMNPQEKRLEGLSSASSIRSAGEQLFLDRRGRSVHGPSVHDDATRHSHCLELHP